MLASDRQIFIKISKVKTQLATICKHKDIVFNFESFSGISDSFLKE
jgi:hypothetical protein